MAHEGYSAYHQKAQYNRIKMFTIVYVPFVDAAKTLTCKLDLCIQINVSETQNDIDYVHID